MSSEHVLRRLIDHRPDIGRIIERIADIEPLDRADEHVDRALGHIFLQEEHARGRTALPGTVKG
jgi:hypothetical protein